MTKKLWIGLIIFTLINVACADRTIVGSIGDAMVDFGNDSSADA